MVDVAVVGVRRGVSVVIVVAVRVYSQYNQEGLTPFSSSRHAYMPRLLRCGCWEVHPVIVV